MSNFLIYILFVLKINYCVFIGTWERLDAHTQKRKKNVNSLYLKNIYLIYYLISSFKINYPSNTIRLY